MHVCVARTTYRNFWYAMHICMCVYRCICVAIHVCTYASRIPPTATSGTLWIYVCVYIDVYM